jgi:hypothetical protein
MTEESEMIEVYLMDLRRTVFHEEIDIDLLQSDAHAGALGVRQHDELDIRRCFVVVQLVLAGVEGDEAKGGLQN